MSQPIKIAVVGCSRGTGLQVVQQGLERGHYMVAISRRPLPLSHENLEMRLADATDEASLTGALSGVQIVISALGVSQREVFGWPTLYSQSGGALASALAKNGIDRLIVVTSGGVEHEDPSFVGFYKWVLHPLLLKRAYDDMRKLEALLRDSGLSWTSVRPSALTDGPKTGNYRISPRFAPPGGLPIARADVAHFLLDVAEQGSWVHATPTLAY